MTRFLSFLVLFSFVLTYWGCDSSSDDTTAVLEVRFKALYDGEPLVMLGEEYVYPDGNPLKLQLFNYYISDLALGQGGVDDAQTLADVLLLDYGEFYTRAEAEQGIVFTYEALPAGSYESLSFGLGINAGLNATTPADYAAGHPLSANHWMGLGSYVFAKIEGSSDLNGDGMFDDKLTYHIGNNDLYVDMKFAETLQLSAEGVNSIILAVDLKDVLESNGNYIDITDEANQADHTNDSAVYEFFWNNLRNAFQVSK